MPITSLNTENTGTTGALRDAVDMQSPSAVTHWHPRLYYLKLITRTLLATVWLFEGYFPKMVNVHPREIALVRSSGLFIHSAELTLAILGFVEVVAGIILLTGFKERAVAVAVTLATLFFSIIVPLNDPAALWDPFGGLVKNLGLVACGMVIYVLAPISNPGTSRHL